MDGIVNALWFIAVVAVVISVVRSAVVPALFLDMVLQVFVLHEIFEVSLKGLVVLGSVPIMFVVGTKLVLIPRGRVTFHWLRPLEEGLRLNLAEELVDWLLEDYVHSFVDCGFTPELLATPQGGDRGLCRGGQDPVPV